MIQFIKNLLSQKPSKSDDVLSNISRSEICERKGHQWTYGNYYGEIICERCEKVEFEQM